MTDEQAKARSQATENLARVDALLDDPHFQWFLATAVGNRVEKERKDALNVSRTPEQRDVSAQRHDALLAVADWAKEQQASLSESLK